MRTLRPYQIEDSAWLRENPHAVCAFQPGLGKTVVGLDAYERLRGTHGAVIVCPPAAIPAWRDEHKHWPTVTTRPRVVKRGKDWHWPKAPGDAVIVTFGNLPWRPVEIRNAIDAGKKPGAPSGKPEIPIALLVDECQALQDNHSLRHQRLRALRKKCDIAWGFSGTPTGGTPFATYHMLNALGCCPWSWYTFLQRFSGYELPYGGYDFVKDAQGNIVVDPRVPGELARVMRRRLRKDVAKDLPPKIYRDRVIPHKRPTSKALTEIWLEMATYHETNELPELVDFARIDRLMAEERIPEIKPSQKIREDRGEIGLMFCAHSEPLRVAASRDGWALIDGSVPQPARERAVRDFEAGRLKGIAINVFSAAVSLNLPSADYVTHIDECWDPHISEQAEDRANRLSRTKGPIEVERWISDHAVCKHRRKVNQRKTKLALDTLGDA